MKFLIEVLHINQYLFLKDTSLYLSEGLNVITGETGTGKSLILDLIGTFVGYTSIRGDSYSAELLINFEKDLPEYNLESGQHVFSVEKSGKRVIFKMDGKLIPKNVMEEIASEFITVHKQNMHIKLLEKNFLLQLIDEYAENGEFLQKYREKYSEYIQTIEILSSNDIHALESKTEELNEKIEEIEKANITIEEESEIEEKYKIASNFQKLAERYNNALSIIDDSLEKFRKIYSLVGEKFESLVDNIIDNIAELQNKLNDEIGEFENVNLEELESRLWIYRTLKRKYGPTIEDVFENYEKWKKELEEVLKMIKILKNAENEKIRIKKELSALAKELSTRRREFAKSLKNKVETHLRDLNMNTVIDFDFKEKGFSPNGIDEVEILGNTIPGMELLPLRKIASGGELSRIMLALELSIASTPILIHDELDTGIGGLTAVKLAEKLEKLSENHQIIVVTHLPQIAMRADKHFLVTREGDKGKVTELSQNERIEEIKRMVGGESITEFLKGGNKFERP